MSCFLIGTTGEKVPFTVKNIKIMKLVCEFNDDIDGLVNGEFRFPTIGTDVLLKLSEYCDYYGNSPYIEIEKPLKSSDMNEIVDKWYADYINIDQTTLFNLILAANYFDVKSLLDLGSAKIASLIKGKSPAEIRTIFNIENDFSPEEEALVIEENKWCEHS